MKVAAVASPGMVVDMVADLVKIPAERFGLMSNGKSEPDVLTYQLQRELDAATERLRVLSARHSSSIAGVTEAWDAVRMAEINLARHLGEEYAEPLDLGVEWEIGAPLPRLFCSEVGAGIVFAARRPRPEWASNQQHYGIVGIIAPVEVRMGGPNEEGLSSLALWNRGLRPFDAHEIHNSRWKAERVALEATYRPHDAEVLSGIRHFYLCFHDSMIESLAWELRSAAFVGTYADAQQAAMLFLNPQGPVLRS